MKHAIIIRPAAEDDLDEAAAWYESKQPGLGRHFLAAVDETFAKLESGPDFGIVVHRALRRASIRRFPYGVFYQATSDRIVVVGVFHARRAPRRWKSRLE